MTPIIVEPGPAATDLEELTLDGLALHSSPWTLEGFEHKPSKKLLEWLKGPDSDGSKLLRIAKHEDAEINLRLKMDQQASMNAALTQIGSLVDKLQEAERQAAGGRGRGHELGGSPAGSTFVGTFYVLAGEVDVPKEMKGDDAGYTFRFPVVNVTLTCSPFIFGAEVVNAATVTSSLPFISVLISAVPGDVEAEVTAILTDAATQTRRAAGIGVENFNYGAGPSLLIDSSSMVTAGFAGSVTTRTGAYSSDGVIRATLTTTAITVCSSAELTHVGPFQNYFRLWPSSTNVSVRLVWRVGRGQWTAMPWQKAPFEDAFWETNLAYTNIKRVAAGTQSWQWRLEAKTTAPGDTVDIDYHAMLPAEYSATVRQPVTYESASAFVARDEFDHTPEDALHGKTLPQGGTWTVVGAGDYKAQAGKYAYSTFVSHASLDVGSVAYPGSTNYGTITVQADVKFTSMTNKEQMWGVAARYTDASNWLAAGIGVENSGDPVFRLYVRKRAAGASTVLASPLTGFITAGTGMFYTVRLAVIGGYWWAWCFQAGTSPGIPVASGYDANLASGTLSTGKPTLYDAYTGAVASTRSYDNFAAFVPTEDAVCFASQSLQFKSYGDDVASREDSSGVYWGGIAARGGRVWLPCAGDDGRTSRVAAFMRRADIETMPSGDIADSTTLAISYRPRWVAIPRQA